MLRSRLCLGVFLVAATPATADEFRPQTTIASVVVYPQGAAVVRTASVTLPAGDSTIFVGDLPAGIDTGSLKVDGSAGAAMSIASVATRLVPADEAVDPERERLLAEIQKIEDRLAGVSDRIAALDGRRRFLERLIETTPEGFGKALAEGGAAIDQWTAAALAIGDGLTAAAEATRSADLEARQLNEILAERRKALAGLAVPQDHIGVTIAVSAAAATSGAISISYRSPSATWLPTYDAQLVTGDEGGVASLSIVRRAEVAQATGEDWSNVALTLSTTRTAEGTAAPFLPANLIALYDGRDYAMPQSEGSMTATRPLAAPGLADMDASGGAVQDQVAKYVEAAAIFGDFRAEYVVPGHVSVESGKDARSLQIATEKVAARIEVRAVPMLSDLAFLHAAFVPPDGAPLLPGKVALFRDGAFVGNGELPLGRAGRELNLGFGIDDRVRVTRVALDRETGEHGLLSSRKTDTQRFKITVDNLHRQPISIAVFDRIPYAEDDKVSIVPVRETTEPTATDVDDRRGVVAWTYVYQPNETREILHGYEVSWPADRQVVSLD
jgi:uncharacterized protein (TIGR02231 family)